MEAAITTIMVSPMARLTASITPATMPGRAAGTSTLRIVSLVVAPIASEPSRIACGTAAMESSAIEETKGMIITPITSPAASALSLEALAYAERQRRIADRRGNGERGEIAIDHSGHARENFERSA